MIQLAISARPARGHPGRSGGRGSRGDIAPTAAWKVALPVALLLLLVAGPAGAANWYVDNALTGSANTGTNWANAWTNFSSATPAGGDTLYISGGTTGQVYNDTLTLVNQWATSEAGRLTVRCGQDAGHTGPVTIYGQVVLGNSGGAPANYVTVDGSLSNTINLFLNSGSWQAVWQRYDHETNNIYRYLDITTTLSAATNSQAVGIQLNSSANNTEIAFCRIHDCGQRGIREGGSVEWYMSRIKVHDCTFTTNLDDPIATTYGLDFYNNTVNGLGADPNTHPDGIQTDAGGMRVWNNVFHDETQGVFIETTANHMENVYVWNNVFYDSGPAVSGRIGYAVCLMFRAKLPNPSSQTWSNIVIANNTFWQMNPSLRIDSDTGVTVTLTNSLFANNLVADSPYSEMLTGTNCTWADNGFPYVTEFWGTNSIAWSGYTFYATPAALAAAHPTCWGSASGEASGYFLNVGTKDFHLAAGVPVSGTNLTSLFTALSLPSTADKDGNTRSASSAWEVGAYVVSSNLPAVTLTANPASISPGEFSTLTWSSSNSTNQTLLPGIGPVGASGATNVYPGGTTLYTLTAIGPGGTNSASATVTVTAPPPAYSAGGVTIFGAILGGIAVE